MSTNINQQMRPADILILIVLSLVWGGSFFFVEILVKHLPPLTIVTVRVGFAAIALWGIIAALKLPLPKTRQHWIALFVVGFLNNALPFCLIAWGQTQISSGLASILNATVPFFTVIIAGTMLADERITKPKFVGVLIGLIGTIILIGPEALKGLTGSMLGQLAVMVAALSYALAAAYSRRFKSWGISPLMIATGQVTMATLMLLPIMLWFDKPWLNAFPPQEAILSLIGLISLSTVIAYILYFRLFKLATLCLDDSFAHSWHSLNQLHKVVTWNAFQLTGVPC